MRRHSREHALQALYILEIRQSEEPELIHNFFEFYPLKSNDKDFAEKLIWGAVKYRHEIDDLLRKNLEHWRIERLSILVRNILRMSVYEMNYYQLTDDKVVIDEALDIVRDFVDDASRSFINSVLQKIMDQKNQSTS